ncbi:serine/threonine-protein kinase [Lignipirellula cremea]|nr:serine/threonine-protein kinase [Lignipirellula cremea]
MLQLRVRQKFDKYRIEKKLGEGGFATVYQALDTIEGIRVALKIPYHSPVDEDVLREVRLTARLDHPNILSLKYAAYIQDHFVIVTPLGERTLSDRLRSRLNFVTMIDYIEQMLEATAHAHREKVMHCDIKPENMILFPQNVLRLADFGLAKVSWRTVASSGSGTLGYMAPEQAMGQASFRSDVFSLGLIICRMLSGEWPAWPYDWPPPGYARIRRRAHADLIQFVQKSMEFKPRDRYRDADQMLNAFRRIKSRSLKFASQQS